MSRPVLFVLGAGANNGAALTRRFAREGYGVALASRSVTSGALNDDGALLVKLDLAQPKAIDAAFQEVKKHFGHGPSVVVYNAGAVKFLTESLEDVSIDDVANTLNINVLSIFAAAKAALAHRPAGERLTFVQTGNFTNTRGYLKTTAVDRVYKFATVGAGRSASAALLEALGPFSVKAHDAHFFYADEREPDGGAMWKGVTADAHADHYFSLVSAPDDAPVLQTFVKGKGYVKFEQDFAE